MSVTTTPMGYAEKASPMYPSLIPHNCWYNGYKGVGVKLITITTKSKVAVPNSSGHGWAGAIRRIKKP
jgi:hypothetical protein